MLVFTNPNDVTKFQMISNTFGDCVIFVLRLYLTIKINKISKKKTCFEKIVQSRDDYFFLEALLCVKIGAIQLHEKVFSEKK